MSSEPMHVIISGTPSTGFTIIGPFSHPSFASEWADAWEIDIDWWVAAVVHPSERETSNPEE